MKNILIMLYEEINKELGTNYKSDNEVNWNYISISYNLSNQFLEKYKDKIDWINGISLREDLSREFIERWKNKLDWSMIFKFYRFDEKFIEKTFITSSFINNENSIDSLFSYQLISESFIEKYENKMYIDWFSISLYQKLSKEFIERHKDKLDLNALKLNTLTQSDIGKKWFIAYINKESYDKKEYYFDLKRNFGVLDKLLVKVRIYYKDILSPEKSNKVDYLREITRYKVR